MPSPYSTDLRERIIAAWKKGDSTWEEIAQRFDVGVATVDRLVALFRRTGSVTPAPHGGGHSHQIDEAGLKVVKRLIDEQNDRTREELVELLAAETGIRVSVATMGRAFRRLGYTRKKKASSRQNPSARA